MISIQSSLTELERRHQFLATYLDCYLQALQNIGQYAVELDNDLTVHHRKHLAALAAEVAGGNQEVLLESRATLRGILRDYRDQAGGYLSGLRDELAGTARALEEILESLGQSDGDHEAQLRGALTRLREVAAAGEHRAIAAVVAAAADTIERSLEQVRKQHQLTVTQFQVEIRMLHKRIDSLEAAASIDQVTQFESQAEMERRIHSTAPGGYCLLLISARGLQRAEVQFGAAVAGELAAAFSKRLRNSLSTTAVVSRWGAELFVVMLGVKKSEATATGKWISDHLSGAYVCLKEGKTVRPVLQLNVGIVDTAVGDVPQRIVQRASAFLGIRT